MDLNYRHLADSDSPANCTSRRRRSLSSKFKIAFLPMSEESPSPSSTSLQCTHMRACNFQEWVENRNDNNVITTHAPQLACTALDWRVESPNHPFSHYDYIKPQTLSFQNPFHALSLLFMHTWSAEWMTLYAKAEFRAQCHGVGGGKGNEKQREKCKML